MSCESRAEQLGEVFRLDAKAEGNIVAIGGWRIRKGENPAEAEWFSLSLTKATAPWAFSRGEPFRTIAALELLGTLVSLMVLMPELEARGESAALVTMTCSTDNQGNSHLLDRLLTTKYPLGVVLMELAHQMRKRRLVLRANWVPRDQNQEADDLTHLEFRHFDERRRIPVSLEDLDFGVMTELFECGDQYIAELDEQRRKAKEQAAKEAEKGAGKKRKRQLRGQTLSQTQPWGQEGLGLRRA